MTLTETVSSSNGSSWVHLDGTIAEVLGGLAAANVSATNVPYWSDDGTDAKAIYCRQK
jgi:hypothetical protein